MRPVDPEYDEIYTIDNFIHLLSNPNNFPFDSGSAYYSTETEVSHRCASKIAPIIRDYAKYAGYTHIIWIND